MSLHQPRPKLASQPDLLTVEPSPAPELVAARMRLALAEQRMADYRARLWDDLGASIEALESEVRLAASDVLRLEREAMKFAGATHPGPPLERGQTGQTGANATSRQNSQPQQPNQ